MTTNTSEIIENITKTESRLGVMQKLEDNFSRNYLAREIYLSYRVKNSVKQKTGCICDNCNLQNIDEFFNKKDPTPVLTRSDYSLVSCTELTPGAVELWMELPEEVKYDPSMANFRRIYEKEHGNVSKTQIKQNIKNDNLSKKRLPLVSSAPHLNNNIHSLSADVTARNGGTIEEDPERKSDNPTNVDVPKHEIKNKMAHARHYVKMSILLACWVFFTIIFMLYNEKEEIVKHSSAAPGQIKNYLIPSHEREMRLLIRLNGPFVTVHTQQNMNSTQLASSADMQVWLERWTLRKNQTVENINVDDVKSAQETERWKIVLQDEHLIDFTEGETRSHVLSFNNGTSDSNHDFVYAVRMQTTSTQTTPFTISYKINPLDARTGVMYSCVLLCGLYILIIFDIINRTMAAILVSTTALAVLSMVGERPSLPELISWLDMETLLLLFSMMLLVAITAETGMFDFLAVFTFEVTKGKMWPLINLLSIITAVLSTFLDNVTTILLMTPVTIRLCEVMQLNPVPILMSLVLYSNIGGTATPVGDPPNVIIASNRDVVASGINFTNFSLHMTVGILFVGVQTYLQLRFMYRDTSKLRHTVPKDIQNLRQQIIIWRRAAASLPHYSQDEHIVRQALERKVGKLTAQLEEKIKETTKRACPKDTFQTTLAELKEKYKIRDKYLLIKASLAIAFVVVVFFLHSIPQMQRVSLGWTALLGAILLLILADREDLEPILHRVEWSTLLFFAALFILMEALSKLGLIAWIGGLTETFILSVNESSRLAVALVLMLWVSGVTSAFVDNIPLTTMMVRVVTNLGSNPGLGLPMAPLIWALSFGACLGGNGTLIGASANVVCAGVAEQHGYRFTFMEFFKVGFPVMIGHLIVATFYLLICHCAFTWH